MTKTDEAAEQLATGDDTDGTVTEGRSGERGYHIEIFAISFAALMLEVAYTRVVSFKLFYYYTFLVIGLALLGTGAGAVMIAVSKRLQQARTDSVLLFGSLLSAISIGVAYLVVAKLGIASLRLWDYGSRASLSTLVRLIIICLALFLSFVGVGVMIATLMGRRTDGIGKLYFADLSGAGIACALAVWLISAIGPPRMITLGAVILAAVAVRIGWRLRSVWTVAAAIVGVLLLITVVFQSVLPDVKPDDAKGNPDAPKGSPNRAVATKWSPIFRVDAIPGVPPGGGDIQPRLVLLHDGTLGSVIENWNGKTSTLRNFGFNGDPRSFPFAVLGKPSGDKVMIIGAAGGHEILASLYYRASKIDAVELNPATYDLVTKRFANYDGHLADKKGVHYFVADGRSVLAHSNEKYNLVWFPAPDSYSATDASQAGAFVLSESYLYTTEAVQASLKHLSPGGILAAQFGELNYALKPNRTMRYVSTARQALENIGIKDPGAHVMVSTSAGLQTTILVKKSPFTAAEIARFKDLDNTVPGTQLQYAPGDAHDPRMNALLNLSQSKLDSYLSSYRYSVGPISDNVPFFWHFSPFSSVIRDFTTAIRGKSPDLEDSIGERVLILLLGIAAALAAVFLLAPFVAVRKTWRRLPRKGISALYFFMLGLGFMFFEVTLIQRFTLFLGFPTYSLTVTLASLLIFTGVGALLSSRAVERVGGRFERLVPPLAAIIVVLGALYLFVLPHLTDALLASSLAVRIIITFVVLAPLGMCLGMFMPIGLRAVGDLTPHRSEYVAWGWAVNGFASVIGSVLTTIIAMSYGFNVVLAIAVVIYLIALASLRGLRSPVVT